MSLISRLRDVIDEIVDPDEALARRRGAPHRVAALLVLVARADGRSCRSRRPGLTAMLRSRFAISRGERRPHPRRTPTTSTATLDQAASLAERILHDIDPEDRPRLLAMAYRVAAVDGFVHEFEDDLVWRIGRLLGWTRARSRRSARTRCRISRRSAPAVPDGSAGPRS